MLSQTLRPASFRRVAAGSGTLVAGIAVVALIGWATGRRSLAAVRTDLIPMAPATALAFLALAGALIAGPAAGARRLATWTRRGVVGAVALLVLARLFEYATGVEFALERHVFELPRDPVGLAPVGKMALFTAFGLLATCAALLALTFPRRPRAADLGGIMGLMVLGLGAVFSLGFLFDVTLFARVVLIPMALPAAVSFLLMGVGIVAAAGPEACCLRTLAGEGVQARLLRVFLPFAVASVVLSAWVVHMITRHVGDAGAAIASAMLAVLTVFVAGYSCHCLARRVGETLETAEAALRRSHAELECKVAERTRELEQLTADILKAHQDLQQSRRELALIEEHLVQSEKLSALGLMVASVAHEISNPLAFVTNNVAILQRDVPQVQALLGLYQQADETLAAHRGALLASIREFSEQIDLPYVLENLEGLLLRSREGLRRIQVIVQDLRDFARADEHAVKNVDLNAGIVSTLGIVQNKADASQVAIETELGLLPSINCHPAKINQVVLNLVVNAIDASPPGASVTVRSHPDTDGVVFEVADRGCGIDPAIAGRIFSPFFTTKPAGKGTGLGLSISAGIIQSHGGRISVESTPGHGSCFTVWLPRGD